MSERNNAEVLQTGSVIKRVCNNATELCTQANSEFERDNGMECVQPMQ